MILREEYFRRLADEAYVDLYLSANDGARIYWPWRMHPPKEANEGYRNACESYIIDSDPKNDDVTSRDVLDTAHRLDAEVASLQDVYQDHDETVESLLHGLEIADSHPFDGDLLLPLQAPYAECYREIGEPEGHWIGIGGLKDASDYERILAAREVREVAPEVKIHGFGWGPGEELAREIRESPGLIDSMDYSTPVQSAPYSDSTSGDERMSVTAAYAGYRLIRDLREVTSFPDDGGSDGRLQATAGAYL